VKEQIAAKLNNMSDLGDRLFLKNVLNDVFLNLHEHSETMYQQLEDRVFAETTGISASYDIYATATSLRGVDPVHYFLRPLRAEDLIKREYDLSNIAETAICKQHPLMKVFFRCDYRLLQPVMTGSRVFQGAIITDQGSVNATFTLRQDRSYLEEIAKLYEIFLNNNIPWKTVNHPYLFRFAEVILESCERMPAAEEVIKEIKVDFAEYGQYVHYDMVPLWNIERLKLKSTGFPIPCKDKINFEHTVALEGIGAEHGYLAAFQGEDISYIRRTRQALIIVAPTQQKDTWEIIRIINPAASKTERHEYPLVSNSKRQAFSDIMAQNSPRVIRTEAELRRLIGSFASAGDLHLSRIAILPRRQGEEEQAASYEMNFFITDEVRRADYQNKLILYFTTSDKENFLGCDLMSFVVSEVQMYYPEYKCEGVIL